VQVAEHVPEPVEPQVVVQGMTEKRTQGNVSSGRPLQSSSRPLHVSAPAAHPVPVGMSQEVVHTPVPVVPQSVVHVTELPITHAKVSSGPPVQSSSRPLHVSAGGVHAEGTGIVHVDEQVPVPVEPHVVVQDVDRPITQAKVSSASPLQLSSTPLQISAPAAQSVPVGTVQVLVQVPEPVEPQVVVQATVDPAAQSNPSSGSPSQSSSTPLQVSTGGLQSAPAGTTQPTPQIPVPVLPQVVVHRTVSPNTQSKPSSVSPSQSSSKPLQSSSSPV
jgi:hypothetical protein